MALRASPIVSLKPILEIKHKKHLPIASLILNFFFRVATVALLKKRAL